MIPTNQTYPDPINKPQIITREALSNTIAKLSPYKAPGPDGICNVVFKECAEVLSPHLLHLFQTTISLNIFYKPWQQFTMVVLCKSGKPDYTVPKAYCPIALLNTTYKLLSAIIAEHLSFIIEKHNLLPDTHFGGRPGRSTTDSLHLLEATIKNAWRSHKVVSVLFPNIEGAFPNAVTDRLLHNMRSRHIPESIIAFMQRALTNRHMKLKFNRYLFQEWIPINNGIGQGDPLSMILYIIYNADLLVVPKGRECTKKTQAFVDDTMLLAISKDFSETHTILKDMIEREGRGYDWAKAHNSKFEMSKFALMDFSPQAKRERPTMNLRGTTLTPTPQHKFLGVIIDHTLRWDAQVSHVIAKGTAYTIQLKRLSTASNGIPLALMHWLYLAIAIPKMLYAVDVWYRPIYIGKDNETQPGSISIA